MFLFIKLSCPLSRETSYSKTVISTAGESGLLLTNTGLHKIIRISKTSQDHPNLKNSSEGKNHQ